MSLFLWMYAKACEYVWLIFSYHIINTCFFQLFLLVFLTFFWFACKTGGLCLLVLRTGACVQESSSMRKMSCGGSMLINWHVYYTFWSTTYLAASLYHTLSLLDRFSKSTSFCVFAGFVCGAQSFLFVDKSNSHRDSPRFGCVASLGIQSAHQNWEWWKWNLNTLRFVSVIIHALLIIWRSVIGSQGGFVDWKEFDHFCNFTGCAIGVLVGWFGSKVDKDLLYPTDFFWLWRVVPS